MEEILRLMMPKVGKHSMAFIFLSWSIPPELKSIFYILGGWSYMRIESVMRRMVLEETDYFFWKMEPHEEFYSRRRVGCWGYTISFRMFW
jgi:hypothetical protein